MFGMEKEKKDRFMFDLEVEIKEKPKRGQELVEKAEKRAQEIKKTLREGASEKEFENFGTLLHASTSPCRKCSRKQ